MVPGTPTNTFVGGTRGYHGLASPDHGTGKQQNGHRGETPRSRMGKDAHATVKKHGWQTGRGTSIFSEHRTRS